jgi:hypothetical protein
MQAHIRYTADTGKPLVNETFGPNNIRRRSSGTEEKRKMLVSDARQSGCSLERKRLRA